VPIPPVAGALPSDDGPAAVGAPLRLLYLSRIDPKKNLELLLDSVALLVRRGLPVRLAIAGDGDSAYIASLRGRVDRLDIAGQVQWLGFVQEPEKAALWRQAELFVLTSHSENFGMAVVEALAAGLPCVLTEGVAVASAVQAAGAGVVVSAEAESVAAGIARLAGSIEALGAAGSAARQLAHSSYSIERATAQLLQLYEHIAAAGHTAARRTAQPAQVQ
jgi:glycosyltransferase involved in cell wall biosynthesis